jgi:hypothetical protein
MTHYQKLATLLFRVIGVIILAVGVFMVLFAIGAAVLVDRRTGIAIGTIYGPPFLLFGGVFFGLSRKLAGWVCHDFEKTGEDGREKAQKAQEEG